MKVSVSKHDAALQAAVCEEIHEAAAVILAMGGDVFGLDMEDPMDQAELPRLVREIALKMQSRAKALVEML